MYNFNLPLSLLGYNKVSLVGSRSIPNAANEKSDYDYLVLAFSTKRATIDLKKLGFKQTSKNNSSYRYNRKLLTTFRNKDNINIILTGSNRFYKRFMQANYLATLLEVTNKEKRIELFQYILYK